MADLTSLGFQNLYLFLLILLTPIVSDAITNQSQPTIVKSMPGFPGDLPFKLESGYIGVGDSEEVQLFYYFTESERDAAQDPLLIWLTGGPGCSGLCGLALEIGPITLNFAAYNSETETPTFLLSPYSWTKVASIIFLDSPVGTGFSYATTPEAQLSDDIMQSTHIHEFLRKWLIQHPKFKRNPFYVAGDSYAGKIVPIVVDDILNGNEIELSPKINLKGYILGNPVTNDDTTNAEIRFAHRISLISDELYESAKVSCNGEYRYVDGNNTRCLAVLEAIQEVFNHIYMSYVLEPSCINDLPKPVVARFTATYARKDLKNFVPLREAHAFRRWCRRHYYKLMESWANDKSVQEALNIRQGTLDSWVRCKDNILPYTRSVPSTFWYHKNFTKRDMRALIYSGDQDNVAPYIDTLEWIKKLDVPEVVKWQPWLVEGQVAGYVTEYSNSHYHLTFTTIRGGGHTAPEYKPQECLAMVDRWFSFQHFT